MTARTAGQGLRRIDRLPPCTFEDDDACVGVDEDLDDEARGDDRLSNVALLAAEALADAVPDDLAAALSAGVPLVVVVRLPDEGWLGPSAAALRARLGPDVLIEIAGPRSRGGAQGRASGPMGPGAVPPLIPGERPIVVVTRDPDEVAPLLATAADECIEVPRLSAAAFSRALKSWCGLRRAPKIRPGAMEGLAFVEVASALRRGASPAECLARLDRARAVRQRSAALVDAPDLATLVGYGEAHAWGLSLVAEIRRVRAGEIAASALESALLHGPPGTGKTTLARAIAAGAGVPYRETTVGGWFAATSPYLDGVVKAIDAFCDELESLARVAGSAIGFLDEIDALPDRRTLDSRNRDYWTTVITHLLTRLERLRRAGVVILAATNHVERIDPALLRPGRIDRRFAVGLPDADDRAAILRQHLARDLASQDLAPAADLADGMTGADLAGAVRAARRAAREAGRELEVADLVDAIAPAERREPALVRAIAVHEAGHAVAAALLGIAVVRVTTIGSGAFGGSTIFDLGEPILDRDLVERRAIALLAARAADRVLGAGAHAGAALDLAQATRALAQLHGRYGLGERLLAIGEAPLDAQLLADPGLRQVVEADLRRLMCAADELVAANAEAVGTVAEALIARRILSGAEVVRLIASAGPQCSAC